MALTFTELQSITNDYFAANGKKAIDIYFNDSFLMDMLMKKRKGLWERPNGGRNIRVPLMYDGAEGDFYTRGEALSSDDRENVNAAFFGLKHVYGNATLYRTDELENAGEYAEVQLATAKLEGAQKTASKKIATSLYTAATDSATTVAYGNIAEADLVAADGSYPWKGNITTTSEAISLAVIRTLRSLAKVSDGPGGKPDIGVTTETLFNVISGLLQTQQRFTQDTDTLKAGFQNLVFEGMIIAADDYATSGYLFALNSKHIGFGIHSAGYFARTPWADLLSAGQAARSMKIFWDGNLICNNRKAHIAHSNLS